MDFLKMRNYMEIKEQREQYMGSINKIESTWEQNKLYA